MESFCIDYRDTGAFSPTVIAYLANDERLQPYFNHPPTPAGISAHLATRKEPADRGLLAKVIREQYVTLDEAGEYPEAVRRNIDALANKGSFTITTGHQLNIFAGPLFFLYKIVTAINLAKQLAGEHPGKTFVPVYWMASEDHDFEEIDHVYLSGKTLSWKQPVKGATGKIPVATIAETRAAYLNLIGRNEHGAKLAEIFEKAYRDGNTLAEATREVVNALFGRYGVVVIDADDARLKKLFLPEISKDILGNYGFERITQSIAGLAKAGFKAQVNPREINFFYLHDGLRERIEFSKGSYHVLNTPLRFTEAELLNELKYHPERFSPNVMLRPLFQEVILPNLAYIGGGAEIGYWLQLKEMFGFYRVDFPVLVLRNSALVLGPGDKSILDEYRLGAADLFLPVQELTKKWVLGHSVHELSIDNEWRDIEAVFQGLNSRISVIDSTLGPSSEAVKARLKHAMDKLERKMLKAEKRKMEDRLRKLLVLRERLFPGGSLQERKENIGEYYPIYGQAFIEALIDGFKPLDFKFSIISPAG